MTETLCPPTANLLESALEYARAGYRIFPCSWIEDAGRCACSQECASPGKHPLISDNLDSATSDENTIRQWWHRWPKANIGLLTGEANGIVVLDLDRRGDIDGVAVAEAMFGWEPEGPYQITGGNGIQAFYRHPGIYVKNHTKPHGIEPGIEVKGDRGYVIVPPSSHISGRHYEWKDHLLEVELPPLPDWLLNRIMQGEPEIKDAFSLPVVIHEGQRNNILTSYGGLRRREGADLAQLETELIQLNRERCRPPLNEREVCAIAKSLSRYFSPVEHGSQVAENLLASKPAEPATPEQPPNRQPEPWKPYPVNALPEPLREYASQVAAATDVDPVAAALPMLSMIAGVIGNTRSVSPKAGWYEPAVLWTLLVAPSGAKKSPVMRQVLAPIREADAEKVEENEILMQQYEAEHVAYQAQMRKGKNQDSDIETPQRPPQTRYVVSDITPEALAKLLQDNPRGLLLDKDELSGWISGFDRYRTRGGSEETFWLSAWCAERAVVDRATKRTVHVPRTTVSITGTIQPGVLQRCFGIEHRENGLLPRMLMAMPPREPSFWTDRTVDTLLQRRMRHIIMELIESLQFSSDGKPFSLALSTDAHREFTGWYDSLAVDISSASGTVSSLLSKLHGYCLRLALVMHLARWADARAGYGDASEVGEVISLEEIQSAIALCNWHADEAVRIMTLFEPEPQQEDQADAETRALVRWIESRGGSVTLRDVTTGVRRYRGKTDEARADVDKLVAAGIGQWVQQDSGGRGRPKYEFMLTKINM